MKKTEMFLTIFVILCAINVIVNCHNIDIQYGVEDVFGWFLRFLISIGNCLLAEGVAIITAIKETN